MARPRNPSTARPIESGVATPRKVRSPRGYEREYMGRLRPDAYVAPVTDLPDANCFKCGARGWCDHRRP